jgi:UDP-N-acetylmuramoyl-L-alanine---L-glutamate ligase
LGSLGILPRQEIACNEYFLRDQIKMKLAQLQSAQTILIYGYGVEGKSTERFLQKRYPKAHIDILDNNIPEFKAAKKLVNYDVLILSPSVPRGLLKGVLPEKITSQTEIFFDNLFEKHRRKVIGITASKGKSTTATFCAKMLGHAGFEVELGGNFGKTFLELFDDFMDDKYDFVVAELSSFQLENLKVSPGIAIFLNIFPEHLDYHNSFDKYFEAKKNLWTHQSSNDLFIVPEISMQLIGNHHGAVYFAPPMVEEYLPNDSIYRARHFRQNLGAIVKLAQLLEIPEKVVQETAQNFEGLPHRLEFFAKRKGIQFCNDSTASNIYATLAGIKALGGNIGSIILGGRNPNVNYKPLIDGILEYARQAHVIIMDTEVKEAIISAIKGRSLQYDIAADLPEVMQQVFEKTPENTVCLFSPAAKPDWFKSSYDRGERFKREVLKSKCQDAGRSDQ